jgi:hypothetical protein
MAPVAGQTTRIPAWKKLGLQLKTKTAESNKRSFDQSFSEQAENKEINDSNVSIPAVNGDVPFERPAKNRKSVSFSEDTKKEDGNEMGGLVSTYVAENTGGDEGFTSIEASRFSVVKTHQANLENSNKPTSHLKSGRTAKKNSNKPTRPENKRPQIVDYLMKFHTDRSNWKFNKHTQTLLLKHIFDLDQLPATIDEALQSYIKGLRGAGPQQLLVRTANSVLEETKDMDMGEFENKDAMEPTQSERLQIDQDRHNALKRHLFNEKLRFREAEDIEEAETEEFQIKLIKRRRAQYILRQLGNNSQVQSLEGVGPEDSHSIPKNRLLSPFNLALSARRPEELEATSKHRKLRHKVNTTGLPDDDIESISSVESILLNDASTTPGSSKGNINDTGTISDSDSVSSSPSSSEIKSETDTESSSESDTDTDDS